MILPAHLPPPVQILLTELSSPLVYSLALVCIFISGGALMFGGELNTFFRRQLYILIVISMFVMAMSIAASDFALFTIVIAASAVFSVVVFGVVFLRLQRPAASQPHPSQAALVAPAAMPPTPPVARAAIAAVAPATPAAAMPPIAAPPITRPVKRKRRSKASPVVAQPVAPAAAISPPEGFTDPLPVAPHVDSAALFQLFPAAPLSDISTWTGQDEDDAPDHDAQTADEWLRNNPLPRKKN